LSKYVVRLKKKAVKDLNKLPSFVFEKIVKELKCLEENPYHHGCEKLEGVEGYRTRMGDYRMLYTINNPKKEIFVYRVRHRKEAYRFD